MTKKNKKKTYQQLVCETISIKIRLQRRQGKTPTPPNPQY